MSPASAAPANGRTSGSPDKSAASIPPPDAKNVSGGCFMTVSVKSPRVLRKSSPEIFVSFSSKTRKALMKSARADSERFCFLRKFEKSRNTVCISDFSNCTEGAKDPPPSRRRFIQRFPSIIVCGTQYCMARMEYGTRFEAGRRIHSSGPSGSKNRHSSTLEIANRFPHNPPFPANNTTVEFGRKEWKRYESNRNRSPGGRSGKNRDTQGNQKNPPHPGGRPAVNIIDREGTVCLRDWKPGK